MKLRFLAVIISTVLLASSAVLGADGTEVVKVYRNQVKLWVNGQQVRTESLLLDGTPYVPVRALSEHLGLDAQWNPETYTASVNTVKTFTLKDAVDPYKPVIFLGDLGLQASRIEAFRLEHEGTVLIKKFDFLGNQLQIADVAATGGSVLDVDRAYTLKLYAGDGARYVIQFVTKGLPEITEREERQVVFVPAMPEKGFYWPYYLAVPSNRNAAPNRGHRRFLMVDTTNTGTTVDVADLFKRASTEVTGLRQLSMRLAEQLWAPMIYPAFPRPSVQYTLDGEANHFYTHALDRDTATLHVKMRGARAAKVLTEEFQRAGFDAGMFMNLDLQLNAMIDHAIGYLNQYGHNVQPKRVFLVGYSASGTFTDRYAALQPDRVKAVASGATLDDMMLPLAEWKGQSLIFPIGVSDYREITGRSFDLQRHNQVARLIYMGEDDTNNTLPYNDCYGEQERQIIRSLWGVEVLPRAKALIELYGQAGGQGIFVLDKGIQHGTSSQMIEYVKTFLQANRDNDVPVYPLPSDPGQLKYTLFE
ncbi:MAG TPA: stalk domain-containing protein [Symbiobacteriaceae bacterium]|nr:stalk domain-containing protein [Symbiobacteriaceae bacterium]